MSKDLVKIKGGPKGFCLMVDNSAKLEDIQAELARKLAEKPEFFPQGTKFQLVSADLNKVVKAGLGDFLTSQGLAVMPAGTDTAKPPGKVHNAFAEHNQQAMHGTQDNQQLMSVINRTVRNGEEITSQGSVMICGNVNPGAKIVAAGSIDIRGTCRGIVHAGAAGDVQAFVVADRMMPSQIRIANLIARSPDNPEKNNYAEKAYIKDGQIVIEPIER